MRYVTFRYISRGLHLFRTPLRPCADGTVTLYTASRNGASRIALPGRKQALQFGTRRDVVRYSPFGVPLVIADCVPNQII